MKKFKFIFAVLVFIFFSALFLFGPSTFAQTTDDQIIDAINGNATEVTLDKSNFEFKQFESCDAMETVLKTYIEKLKVNNYRGPIYYMRDGIAESAAPTGSPIAGAKDKSTNDSSYNSSSNDFSTTNLQKAGVEEPEIIKTDGNYIYYYNQQEQKIYILKSPLDVATSKIDINKAEAKTIINLPMEFYNTQLFIQDGRLIIIGTRYAQFTNYNNILDRSSRTSVAIYDISNITNPKLLKLTDLDGRYNNARMIGSKLYVLSTLNINRRYFNQNEKYDLKAENLIPKALEITNNESKAVAAKCSNISYILPTDDTLENSNLNPELTIISILDTQDTTKETVTNVLLSQAGQIHMTKDSLYIAQNIWFNQRYACPMGARCMMPWFDQGSETLIHKFSIGTSSINYESSNLVPGELLTQYSMDEDLQGNFRILTRKNRSDGTNFYAFDDNLKLAGKIEGIEPGEQFKASRYIEDKLYLVTFEQTDPLFVVDIADISKPKIVGQVKIPGFSTYLHPVSQEYYNCEDLYSSEQCKVMRLKPMVKKQYLIGLGYGAGQNERGGTVTDGLQLSLYEVDYSAKETIESKCGNLAKEANDQYVKCGETVETDNIRVTQIANNIIGGKGSYSEVLDNPRMFVMDKNNNVTMPMILQEEVKNGENCSIYKDSNGVVTKTDCYPIVQQKTIFAGLKSFKFDTTSKTISEKASIDYLDLFKKVYPSDNSPYYNVYSRQIQNSMMRVGFAGDLLYMVNNDFAHFTIPGENIGKYISFDKSIN